LEEGIEFLDTAELLYVSPDDRRLINTLPANIQAEVDRVALQWEKSETRKSKSETTSNHQSTNDRNTEAQFARVEG
jgi:hypothetical protein